MALVFGKTTCVELAENFRRTALSYLGEVFCWRSPFARYESHA
ncbi:MAG TPA: hypothetical protein V6D11_13610 [Waterburya sp.]